ncbi:universal stress protein [Streptomyces sp. H27-G5]|uniref:universal stress protein n=1 Tax=Streptomyces sp. H27-G5 TaxID=2996698 RepID=UPI002272166B|nr:universal stress protein [Streptomyces sp. H27-G5]MCY0922527.1 universal stress protein [Streptomyces sp. H27-G5]
MNHHVTVGVDGTPESLAAARWAAREATLRQAPLRIVHAEDWSSAALVPELDPGTRDRWADEVLASATDELKLAYPRLEISTRRLSGRPATALAAEAQGAGLLVLGSRGLGSVVGFVVGSVGLSTLAASETPVVLVRADEGTENAAPTAYGEIVVGVDIHQACDRVLAFAFEEASRRECVLRAVHGWKLPSASGYSPVLNPSVAREVDRTVAQMLDDMLMPWRLKFPDVRLEEKTLIGPAGRELVQAASDADLVVIGRRIRRSNLGTHLGAVAHAVLHHTAAPVAVLAHD